MEQNTNRISPATISFGIGASIAIIFNTLLAWLKDSHPAVNDAMKAATGHHWITHGILVVLVFLLFGLLMRGRFLKLNGGALSIVIFASVLFGGFGLVGWFLLY